MKHGFIPMSLLLLALSTKGMAQTDDKQAYEQYRQQTVQQYNDFQRQAIDEFQRFLSEAWTSYHYFKGTDALFSKPKPANIPDFLDQSEEPASKGESYEPDVKDKMLQAGKTIIDNGTSETVSINYYGCRLNFKVPASLRIKSQGTKERQVANYYARMSEQNDNQAFLRQIEETIRRMGLNDWGYFTLMRSISEKTFAEMDDRVLFCFFMLRQEGFRARIGREQQSGKLKLLIAIDNTKEVYSLSFYRFNGVKYYSVYGGTENSDILSYNEKSDDKGLRQFNLDFKETLNMAACDKTRTLTWGKDKATLTLPYSNSHLRFLDDMPLTVIPVYCKSDLPIATQKALDGYFGQLKQKSSQVGLVESILNFVQTAFQYKIDEEQFGREKYFFPEEVIAYPYSDCEDRCALFAWLVNRYTDCETIGVLYPDHLAMGVSFGKGNAPKGQNIHYQGNTFILCDPTYPNAPIGTTLPQLKSAKYEIVEIK